DAPRPRAPARVMEGMGRMERVEGEEGYHALLPSPPAFPLSPPPLCSMRRLFLLVFPFLLLAACAREPEPGARGTRALAAEYLWSQQAEDGGWHSATHGIVRGGQAWTPFVLHALLQVPEDVAARPEGGVERALGFIRAHVDTSGALG